MLTACGGAVLDEEPGPEATATAPASAPSEPDAAQLAAYRAEGLDEAQALYLALTRLDGSMVDDGTAQLTASFPSGNIGEFRVTLTPGVAGDPSAPPRIDYVADDDLRFSIEYFVASDAIPAEVGGQTLPRTGLASPPEMVFAVATERGLVAAETTGSMVVVEAVVKQFNSHSTGELAKLIEAKLNNGAEVKNFVKALKAGASVLDALSASDEYKALEHEVDALEECARNPTNPVTTRAYRDDPTYRDQILGQVAAVREELKANTAVSYLSHMIKTGSSLIPEVPWVGYVVGPGTAWSKAALADLNRKLIDDLRKNITPCEKDFRIDKTVSRGELSVTYTIRYTAVKCGGIAGTWEIDSAGTLTGGGDTASIGGPWTVEIPEGGTSGTFSGIANFHDDDAETSGAFGGTATVTEDPQALVLEVTSGGGDGYWYGFTETSLLEPGTLTLPLEPGDFCD